LPDEPTPDAHIVALAVPLLVTAATVGGIAIAMARDADALHCPVDNALADGPPLWVHEGEIERCFVAALPVKDEDLPRSHRSSTGPENASQPEAPARAGRRRSGLGAVPLRSLRDRAYAAGGADSWAAYCLYSDPLARALLTR
jgi:hypothetical protein